MHTNTVSFNVFLYYIFYIYTTERLVAVVKGCLILIDNVALYKTSKNVTLFHG